jgi:organic radical activating enzyme
MRKAEMREVQFHQTLGNCPALLVDRQLWPHVATAGLARVTKPDAQACDQPADVAPPLLTVNWHLEKDCNYKCSFCYAHFEGQRNLDQAAGLELLELLRDHGIFKVNFAGGEPMLNKNLGIYLKQAKRLGLKTSIITNASRLTSAWLEEHARFIDQVGISCDSLDDTVNKALGRGFGSHVAVTSRALTRVREVNAAQGLDVKVKLNTVVMAPNHAEVCYTWINVDVAAVVSTHDTAPMCVTEGLLDIRARARRATLEDLQDSPHRGRERRRVRRAGGNGRAV